MKRPVCDTKRRGFTLLEMSVVLVIIGLVMGSVLFGKDLIKASKVRSQISQIEKFNSAAVTFDAKYGYLPGDIIASKAALFGFAARGTQPGQGDGNGVIQGGCSYCGGALFGWTQGAGETVMFWVDLSTAGLIDGGFSTASSTASPSGTVTGSNIDLYLPAAKIGAGNYVYVWTDNNNVGWPMFYPDNWFGISGTTGIYGAAEGGNMLSTTSITVLQAYSIDQKIDDGFPLTGNVQALGVNANVYWVVDNTWGSGKTYAFTGSTTAPLGPPSNVALTPSVITCFDNAGNAANQTTYSLTQQNGNGLNCAVSFRMKGGT